MLTAAACLALRGQRTSTARMASATMATEIDFAQGMGDVAAAGVADDMEVILVSCLSDNYVPILHDPETGATAVIDTPEVEPIMNALDKRGWKLTHILNTHHHADHAGGNEELKKRTGAIIVAPAGEASKIRGIDVTAKDGDKVKVGHMEAQVLEVGGHTLGHIAYHFPKQRAAFVGDALFVLGCGRIFEGTPAQMWESLLKLRELPDDTVVYCAHEYTQSNAKFASHVGGVPGLEKRVAVVQELRSAGKATVPTLLGHEKATNPFLRADIGDDLRVAVGLDGGASPLEIFTELRRQKDNF